MRILKKVNFNLNKDMYKIIRYEDFDYCNDEYLIVLKNNKKIYSINLKDEESFDKLPEFIKKEWSK